MQVLTGILLNTSTLTLININRNKQQIFKFVWR